MIFKNRSEAGKLLAQSLENFKNAKNTLVIGLARGGMITAAAVANELDLPLDVTCPRKLGAPFNSELAIGAITELGDRVLNNELIHLLNISEDYLEETIQKETKKAQERVKKYRAGKTPLSLKNQSVILVDDGLATGATMKAAIKSAKEAGAQEIIVAIPVAPPQTINEFKQLVNKVICLSAPKYFEAVGEFYAEFLQINDDEVIALLQTPSQSS